jgi:hypothetical protein
MQAFKPQATGFSAAQTADACNRFVCPTASKRIATTSTLALVAGVFVALGAILLSGCAGWGGQPKALDTLYDSYEKNRVAYYEGLISNSPSAAVGKAKRNEVMNDLILLIDHNFARSEKSLYGHKAWADFGGSVAATGLSTAATLTGAEGVKTTLSALVTAIEGTKTSFGKDILQGQSILAVVTQMHKLRAEKIVEMRQAMHDKDVDEYPLSYGLVDLLEYHNDGTFLVALQSMTEDAAAKKKDAETKLKDLKSAYVKDDAGEALRKFWKPDGKTINDKNETALEKWLEKEGIASSIPYFIRSAQFASQRKKAVAELIKKETGE